MTRDRGPLPQLADRLFVTDGGLETTLIFQHDIELPHFAAFVLLASADGRETLRDYYRGYARIAREHGTGFVLESPTWRSSRDWGARLGYSPDRLAEMNRLAIDLMVELRDELEDGIAGIVVSGALGPRGDGYVPGDRMSADEAETYHREQIATFRDTPADLVTAFTLPYSAEGVGIARAAAAESVPSVIGFTVETDGRLPSGETLKEAVTAVEKESGEAPAYYMVNCAHPAHFAHVITDEAWTRRIRAIRANASTRSHAELDEATELDAGDPPGLAADYVELLDRMRAVNVVGGCCGTDERHVAEICRALLERDGGWGRRAVVMDPIPTV